MEKRSRRRIRDLVTQLASQGLSENENGRARISMMAKSNERSTQTGRRFPPPWLVRNFYSEKSRRL